MKSAPLGKHTSKVEVTNVSKHGFRLIIGEREVFLSFDHFPWFKECPIGRILNVELPHPQHLYWPDLDIDIAVESIDYPERFPLVSRQRYKKSPPGKTMARRLRSLPKSSKRRT